MQEASVFTADRRAPTDRNAGASAAMQVRSKALQKRDSTRSSALAFVPHPARRCLSGTLLGSATWASLAVSCCCRLSTAFSPGRRTPQATRLIRIASLLRSGSPASFAPSTGRGRHSGPKRWKLLLWRRQSQGRNECGGATFGRRFRASTPPQRVAVLVAAHYAQVCCASNAECTRRIPAGPRNPLPALPALGHVLSSHLGASALSILRDLSKGDDDDDERWRAPLHSLLVQACASQFAPQPALNSPSRWPCCLT